MRLPLLLVSCALGVMVSWCGAEDAPVAPGPTTPPAAEAPKPANTPMTGRKLRAQIINERLLQYFGVGIEAPVDWHIEVEQMGGRIATNAMYLSGEADTNSVGDELYFFKYNGLENHLLEAQKANEVSWMTFYTLAQSAPAHYKPGPAQATPINAKVPGTMRSYWEIFKRCMLVCAKHPDIPTVMQIEPDEWGHLLLAGGMDPNKDGIALVGGSGMPELAGVPNTVNGWAHAFRILRDRYAPHVILCANPSAWDAANSMSAASWVKIFQTCQVTPEGGWDLFVAQEHDWDTGLKSNGPSAKWPPYKESDLVGYEGSWDGLCRWINGIHVGTGMWCAMWQLPQGNAYFCTCDGSDGHGCDGYEEALFEGYPKTNGLIEQMVNSGCCLWIFSHGGGGSSVSDAKKDGITNPPPIAGNKGHKSKWADDDGGYMRIKCIEYAKHPFPILGKKKGHAAALSASITGPATGGDDAKPAETDKPRRTATLSDKSVLAQYNARLLTRIQQELAAGRMLTISYSALRSNIRIDTLTDGQMTVQMEDGGQMNLPWTALTLSDLTQLSLIQVRENKPEDHALAGFYLLASGDLEKGEQHLSQASGFDQEVRKAFTIQ